MGWMGLVGSALNLVTTVIDKLGDIRMFKKKTQYQKLLEELEELRNRPDEEVDDNALMYKRDELDRFMRIWANEIRAYKVDE